MKFFYFTIYNFSIGIFLKSYGYLSFLSFTICILFHSRHTSFHCGFYFLVSYGHFLIYYLQDIIFLFIYILSWQNTNIFSFSYFLLREYIQGFQDSWIIVSQISRKSFVTAGKTWLNHIPFFSNLQLYLSHSLISLCFLKISSGITFFTNSRYGHWIPVVSCYAWYGE
jgi:hypothetical protein